MATSYKAEVLALGETSYSSNGLRFATKDEAQLYADDLAMRWSMVDTTRIVEVEGTPNYKWDHSKQTAVSLTP